MTQYKVLDQFISSNNGMVKTSDALVSGVSKPVFYQYVKEHHMERAAHGIYISKDSWMDGMYLLHVRCEEAVFSHESALLFHGLTDREPAKYTVTMKTGYNPSRLTAEGVKVYTVKKELHLLGICEMMTPFGHSVPVYNMERTMCDLVRSRNNIETQDFLCAMKEYARRKDKNLPRLMQYAKTFHVEKIMIQYMEILH